MLPISAKRFSIYPIPKPGKLHDRRPISLIDVLEAFVSVHISKHLSDGLETANILSPFITVYRKGKSIDDITLAHLLTFEDINQCGHCLLGIISDDEDKFFERISIELLYTALIQHGNPQIRYVEWAAESLSDTSARITTPHGVVIIHIECGAQQGGPTVCPFSNTVASFKTRAFDQTPTQPYPPLAPNYAHSLHHRDMHNTLHDVIIHIVSYCDDSTRYTAVLTLSHIISQIQFNIDRAGDFSLITKLGRKHTKCSVAIINHPPDESTPTLISTTWSYDHNGPYTCPIQTHTQSLHLTEYHDNTSNDHNSDDTSTSSHTNLQDLEFVYNPAHDSNFYGIPHTLTTDIFTAPTQSLRKSHARLNTTRRAKLRLVTIPYLLSSLTHSICSYNPLCTLIPHQHYLMFDKRTHNLYLSATSHTRTQPTHATFLDRTHHGLHIPSMLNHQLKSCARELDVRLNSNAPLQSAFPRARLTAMYQNYIRAPNLVHAASRYIITYVIHLRDADQPIITNPLQTLLHHTLLHHTDTPILHGQTQQPHANKNPTPFNISGDGPTLPLHTPTSPIQLPH